MRAVVGVVFSTSLSQQLCRFEQTITIKEAIKTYLPYDCTRHGQRSLWDGKQQIQYIFEIEQSGKSDSRTKKKTNSIDAWSQPQLLFSIKTLPFIVQFFYSKKQSDEKICLMCIHVFPFVYKCSQNSTYSHSDDFELNCEIDELSSPPVIG